MHTNDSLSSLRLVFLLAASGVTFLAGCSGGGGSGSSAPAEDVAPSLELRQSVRSSSGTFDLDPRASDRNRDALAFTWTLLEGPSNVYLAGDPGPSGATQIIVPLNGVYTFEVAVSDGAHTVTSETVVTVEDPAAFRFEGRLLTAGAAEAGVATQLVWSQAGTAVSSTRTSASGTFQFPAVLGTPGDFTVQVAASGAGGP
jgi:hypothetical protein